MDRPLKILVVLPMYGGSLPIGNYCVSALRGMGHLVDVFDAPEFHTAHMALRSLRVGGERQEQLEAAFANLLSQAVQAKTENFRPDLVLAMAQAPLSRQVLRRLRKEGIPSAMWFVEDYKLFTYWQAYAPLYDFFFVIQKSPFLERLQEAGVKNAMYLPLAALPGFHQKAELSPAQAHSYGADLSFMGAGYPNRRVAFKTLLRRNFKIWGSDWDGDSLLAPLVQKNGERISPEEALLIYSASKINLNLHSSVKADKLISGGDFVNPRTFELASMGAFQLLDERSLLPELFKSSDAGSRGELPPEDAELAVFSDPDGMESSIAFYLAHPEIRERMAEKAQARVLAEHTYQHRMQSMLDFIAERLPGWPYPVKTDDFPPGLSEADKTKISKLLDRLQLPPHAAFNDVITALRQESGVLGHFETSLLFLDEWRKQYSNKRNW